MSVRFYPKSLARVGVEILWLNPYDYWHASFWWATAERVVEMTNRLQKRSAVGIENPSRTKTWMDFLIIATPTVGVQPR
jgi:hypothetical protein